MNRRDFLKNTATIAALGTVLKVTGGEVKAETKAEAKPEEAKKADADKKEEKPIDIVAVRNGEPAAMFAAAMKELGGMGAFVKKDQTVVIKPNMAWDKAPEMAATTNPDLMDAVLKAVKEAGAKKIYLIDTTCDNWERSFKTSKIEEVAKKYGAECIGGDTSRDKAYVEKYFVEVEMKGTEKMKKMTVNRLLKECDVFINVPILKNHEGATMTCCMKNMMGTVTKAMQQEFHRKGLHQCIAECCSFRKPDLNIVDAYRVMTKRGPRGVDTSDVKLLKYLLAGKDMVALDTLAAKLLEFPLDRIQHVKYGEKLGLGSTDIEKKNIKRITLS